MKPWRETIERTYSSRANAAGTGSHPVFSPPASILDVEAAEKHLTTRFPETLKSILSESDGVMDQLSVDGGPYFDNMWLLWPVRQIVDENLEFRKHIRETSSNHDGHNLVFIASAGVDGILFGFESTDKLSEDCPIVSWHPVGKRICRVADSVADFLDGWLCNRISV